LQGECLVILTGHKGSRLSTRSVMLEAEKIAGTLSVGAWGVRPAMDTYLKKVGFQLVGDSWDSARIYRDLGGVKIEMTLGLLTDPWN
jgi:hypothetical protein